MEIVKKIWGEEHWLANDDFCCKELIINKGCSCSLHYHKIKDELFYISYGKVEIQLERNSKTYNPGEHCRVRQHVRHRFTALENSMMIECSTHHEDSDSYRIKESKKA